MVAKVRKPIPLSRPIEGLKEADAFFFVSDATIATKHKLIIETANALRYPGRHLTSISLPIGTARCPSALIAKANRMAKAIWKIMLRRQAQRNYHYTATKHSRRAPKRGEAISVRDTDATLVKAVMLVKAVIGNVRHEQRARHPLTRVFTVQADELEA